MPRKKPEPKGPKKLTAAEQEQVELVLALRQSAAEKVAAIQADLDAKIGPVLRRICKAHGITNGNFDFAAMTVEEAKK